MLDSYDKDIPLLEKSASSSKWPKAVLLLCCLVATAFYSLLDVRTVISPVLSEKNELVKHEGRAGALYLKQPKLCDPEVKQYSGYFTVNRAEHKKYFFWFFEARNSPATAPTAMWLSGGPGASSMFALLGENGPCTVNPDGLTTSKNPFSWTEVANMVWVDQPAGTGFSQGAFDSNEAEVSWDMYIFVHTLMERFPEFNRDFYVVGESYGGHYVPSVTSRIVRENSKLTNPSINYPSITEALHFDKIYIDVKGMAIGNGMTNTLEQIKWSPLMAYNSGTAPSVVDEGTYNKMVESLPEVEALVQVCAVTNDDQLCMEAWQAYTMNLMLPVMKTNRNMYDLRLLEPYNFSAMHSYLNEPSVQRELGVSSLWNSVNISVWLHLAPNDFLRSYEALVPPILAAGLDVLIYAGDQDFACDWLGNHAWTDKLEWPGRPDFNSLLLQDWRGDESEPLPGGALKRFKNLAFMRVSKAGHLVPMDQPRHALKMFSDFVKGSLA